MQLLTAPLLLLCFGVYGAFADEVAWPNHGVVKLGISKAPSNLLTMEIPGCITVSVAFVENEFKAVRPGQNPVVLNAPLKKDGGKLIILLTKEDERLTFIINAENPEGTTSNFTHSFEKVTCNLSLVQVRGAPKDQLKDVHLYVSDEIVEAFRASS